VTTYRRDDSRGRLVAHVHIHLGFISSIRQVDDGLLQSRWRSRLLEVVVEKSGEVGEAGKAAGSPFAKLCFDGAVNVALSLVVVRLVQ
jgi:hypothetical protein